jgi:hypothetical protein
MLAAPRAGRRSKRDAQVTAAGSSATTKKKQKKPAT